MAVVDYVAVADKNDALYIKSNVVGRVLPLYTEAFWVFSRDKLVAG